MKPVVLTIAGLDPSGGAGIVADIKTIAALRLFSRCGADVDHVSKHDRCVWREHQIAATLRAQVEPIVQDLNVAAAKTGMLPTAEIVAEVARLFAEEKLPAPVVDPVVVATSGDVLIDEEAFRDSEERNSFRWHGLLRQTFPKQKSSPVSQFKAKPTCDARLRRFNRSARAQCW